MPREHIRREIARVRKKVRERLAKKSTVTEATGKVLLAEDNEPEIYATREKELTVTYVKHKLNDGYTSHWKINGVSIGRQELRVFLALFGFNLTSEEMKQKDHAASLEMLLWQIKELLPTLTTWESFCRFVINLKGDIKFDFEKNRFGYINDTFDHLNYRKFMYVFGVKTKVTEA